MAAKSQTDETTTLLLRGASRRLIAKLKAAAALQGYTSMQTYALEQLENHVADLEKRGILPRPK